MLDSTSGTLVFGPTFLPRSSPLSPDNRVCRHDTRTDIVPDDLPRVALSEPDFVNWVMALVLADCRWRVRAVMNDTDTC